MLAKVSRTKENPLAKLNSVISFKFAKEYKTGVKTAEQKTCFMVSVLAIIY